MLDTTDFKDDVRSAPPMVEGLTMLQAHDRRIPGSWSHSLRRYLIEPRPATVDAGSFSYSFHPTDSGQRHVELVYWVSGRCKASELRLLDPPLRLSAPISGEGSLATLDILRFRFEPSHLSLYARSAKKPVAEMLQFRHRESFTRPLTVDKRILAILETLIHGRHDDETGNIVFNSQTQILLLHSLRNLYGDPDESEVPACKFLDNEADREKIARSREILIQHIGDPITIRALSRKVAINECYLKKGFKVMFGCTIFEFYQDQRMEHAKFLLYERGRTVSEVSAMLGYSSISHFSTAFKKHTGLKPCELLMRQ